MALFSFDYFFLFFLLTKHLDDVTVSLSMFRYLWGTDVILLYVIHVSRLFTLLSSMYFNWWELLFQKVTVHQHNELRLTSIATPCGSIIMHCSIYSLVYSNSERTDKRRDCVKWIIIIYKILYMLIEIENLLSICHDIAHVYPLFQ